MVLDTAPTGHTLLLLDAAEAYHREVSRTQGAAPDAVRQLLPRLAWVPWYPEAPVGVERLLQFSRGVAEPVPALAASEPD